MKKILIIEDDALIARAYGSKYGSAGYETQVAEDGEAGLALVQTFKPDLVHLDLGIPRVNGAEIIRRIRAQPLLGALPIVVLTNTYQNRMVKAAIDAGATRCVSKATCTPRMMLEVIDKLLSRGPAAQASAAAVPPTSLEPESKAPTAPENPPAVEATDDLAEEIIPVPHDETPSLAPQTLPAPAETFTRETERHEVFHARIHSEFLKRRPELLAALYEPLEPLLRAEDEEVRIRGLSQMCRAADRLASHSGLAGFEAASEMAGALAALLRELVEGPSEISASTLRTIVDTCDSLRESPRFTEESANQPAAPPVVLVVDDDPIARRAICLALARINVAAISVDGPVAALGLLAENKFGLIFLDVQMPDMNGFDLCRQLRTIHPNESTPVVFVTTLSEYESRERAAQVGGNDLIAKPFLPIELAVKALSLLRPAADPSA